MSIQWQDNGYTFYGKESLPHTARMQDPGSMECWAFCLGAVAGLPWSTVATHTALGDLTHGQNTANTNLLVERLNQLPGGPTLRLPARWYSPTGTATSSVRCSPRPSPSTTTSWLPWPSGKRLASPTRSATGTPRTPRSTP